MTFESEAVNEMILRREKYLRWEKRNRHIKTMANWSLVFFGVIMTLIVVDILDKVK